VQKDEYEALLSELEIRLERLRSLYEQYFIGIEKLEPAVARKDVDRRFWELRRVRIRNTALRFRFQTLVQRYNTLQQYWIRICRQIENGTYSRHVRKAARLASLPPAPAEPSSPSPAKPSSPPQPKEVAGRSADGSFDLAQMLAQDMASDSALGDAVDAAFAAVAASGSTRLEPKQVARSAPASPKPAPTSRVAQAASATNPGPTRKGKEKSAKGPADAGDARFAALHAELSKARKGLKQGEISLQAVANRLASTEAQLRSKHPGRTVDFRVEVKDGKAIIKPFLR
jgi:hypothetical protein